MEPSTTTTIINNPIFSLNLNVVLNLFVYAFFASAGVTTASKLVVLLAKTMIHLLHQKHSRHIHDRKNLRLEIIKICNEGSTTGWNIKPRDIEHIFFVGTLLEAEDKKASDIYNKMISRWVLNATRQKNTKASKENINYSIELQNDAQTAREKLLTIVAKWK